MNVTDKYREIATEFVRRNVQCTWGCKPPYGFDACSTHQGAMHDAKQAIADAEARGPRGWDSRFVQLLEETERHI